MGFYIVDTAGSFRYAYHYKQIGSIGKKQKGFNVSGSGAALLGGGVVITLASGVVYLVDRQKFSPGIIDSGCEFGNDWIFHDKKRK